MINQKVFTPSLRALHEHVGQFPNLKIVESSLNTKKGEWVLLTGSILDKSEIDYRTVTNTQGIYFTVIPHSIMKSDIDDYWFSYTKVLYKSELVSYLASV